MCVIPSFALYLKKEDRVGHSFRTGVRSIQRRARYIWLPKNPQAEIHFFNLHFDAVEFSGFERHWTSCRQLHSGKHVLLEAERSQEIQIVDVLVWSMTLFRNDMKNCEIHNRDCEAEKLNENG